ncbi:hypothetical protein BGO17_04475 [Candidatus Saccharibacteria bacterium 49-20]|nr:MAG: hypothetical protein BGO17_04475 [Candidatus Saccharibacteria bacterium 49-20]
MTEVHINSTYADRQGGKALGLHLLRDMGYQVPDYFVVSHDDDSTSPEAIARFTRFATQTGRVAVRSSANIEDGAHYSFAGQFDSYLDVPADEIPARIADVRESITSDHVRQYTEAMGLAVDDIKMNVIVQQFEEPNAGGVWMGTGASGGRLEWVDGRGDAVVNGTAEPYFESYGQDGTMLAKNADLILADDSGRSVAEVCKEIQEKLGYNVDLEFCITKNGVQWLQLRKVTKDIETHSTPEAEEVLEALTINGEAASPYTASGTAYRLDQKGGIEWGMGKILIARATSPADMMYIMTAEGVVTRMGGMLSHSAVVCRELGKACVVGVDIDKIDHGSAVSIDGKAGKVFLS